MKALHFLKIFSATVMVMLMLVSSIAQNNASMQLARDLYFDNLPFPKEYRPGKCTMNPFPDPYEKGTVLELNQPGEITRIWATHRDDRDVLKLWIYVDDNPEPILVGTDREVAAAAQKLSNEAVPWGGFLDGKSASLYLPIPFQHYIRIDAEYESDKDGPYFQVDYMLKSNPDKTMWKQVNGKDGIELVPTGNFEGKNKKKPVCRKLVKEFKVANWPQNILIDGPAVIRKISIKSGYIDKLLFRASFDDESGYTDKAKFVDNLDFQVNVPLKYMINQFNTAGVQRIGNEGIIWFPMPFKKRALIQLQYFMDEIEFHSEYPVVITIEYEENPDEIDNMYYFNAEASTEVSKGYEDFEVLNVRGEGHFVGVNLFNTNHDHGGGDNIFFDAGSPTAGQLHGICGEDYFHHAYMRIGVSAPYTDCPTHSARSRHHIEMPIPFKESFVFNWGAFKGVMPAAVALWYQKEIKRETFKDLTYELTGPFKLEYFDDIAPGKELPSTVYIRPSLSFWEFPARKWHSDAQNGFLDLCHAYRQYNHTIPPTGGSNATNCCMVATTKVWVEKSSDTKFIIGCDDPVKVYLGSKLIGEKSEFDKYDSFEQIEVNARLNTGMNTITLVVANKRNTNWSWNGFSLVLENSLEPGKMLYVH
ncbi:MAG: DUF2961 domain-containing protein [Bacteroidota bacterium]